MNVTKAREITPSDLKTIVAIIGDGLDLDHPDLVHSLVPGTDFFDEDGQLYPPVVNWGALAVAADEQASLCSRP